MVRLLCSLLVLAVLCSAPAGAEEVALSDKDREHYKNAFLHFNKQRLRDARLHAARAKEPLPAKVIQWLILTRKGANVDFDEAMAFFEANTDWPRRLTLRRAIERAMPWTWPDAKMLAWFEANPAVSVDGALRHIAALMRAGRKDAAIALARETWRNGDFDREQERVFRKHYRKHMTWDDHVARLDRLLRKGSTRTARRHAQRMGDGYPQLAQARLALAARKPGVDYAIRQVPASLRGDPGLAYERARWRLRKDRYDGVLEMLDAQVADSEARPTLWWPIRRWAVREAIARGDAKVAYRIASTHGLQDGLGFAEAEWLAGWTALSFLGQPKQAYKHFSHLYYGVSSPISRARGAYWAGEAASAMGNEDWSTRWYGIAATFGTTFYGQLAQTRLGHAVAVDAGPATAAQPSAAARAAFDQWELVRIVRLLGILRQDKHREVFIKHLGDLADGESDFMLVATLAKEQNRPDLAMRTAKQARSKDILLIDMLYPRPALAAPAKAIEPALLLAVVRQESAFDSRAVSGAGARGMMQLMPATAKYVAKRLRLKYSRDRLTSDPAYNLRLGQAYLASLLTRYRGSHLLALAAYNAGPPAVGRWIRAYGDPRRDDVDPIEWIERVPFSETRNYVMRVLESLVVYRDLLGEEQAELPLAPSAIGDSAAR